MLQDNQLQWRCGSYELSLARPRIMGVLNVTPDSFSDGGDHAEIDQAIEWGMKLLDDGADIIDIGGESTRPGFSPVNPDEEGKRVLPVVRALAEAGAIVSIDTRHPEVARLALKLGASIVNDVEGFTNPDMVRLAAESDCGCIIMHAGEAFEPTPRRLIDTGRAFTLPEEAPIMRRVMGFLGDQARILMREGIDKERICIDPGPGFDKNADEDVVIQRATAKMASMGYPLLCAVSRKRFVGAVSGVVDAPERDTATVGVCISAVASGARILRVHDVAGCAQALNSYWATSRSDERRAFVALGSNVGDPLDNLSQAIARINAIPLTCVSSVSNAYRTDPAYGIETEVANAVIEIKTELAPLVLMDKLLEVENELGRVRLKGQDGHGPRTIDCDLIWMENEIHAGRKLTLPHPRAGERDFVITPMEDLVHDAARFLSHVGLEVAQPDQRVGTVRANLGEISWT